MKELEALSQQLGDQRKKAAEAAAWASRYKVHAKNKIADMPGYTVFRTRFVG